MIKERDSIALLGAICAVGTVLELFSWSCFYCTMVPSKKKWFVSNTSRREHILARWNGELIGEGREMPSISGMIVTPDYFRAFWVATRMPRYLSLVDVKGWIDANRERWNDKRTMPDFWRLKSWRQQAAKCCGCSIEALGYAPQESSELAVPGATVLVDSSFDTTLRGSEGNASFRRRRGSHDLGASLSRKRSFARNTMYKNVFGVEKEENEKGVAPSGETVTSIREDAEDES